MYSQRVSHEGQFWGRIDRRSSDTALPVLLPYVGRAGSDTHCKLRPRAQFPGRHSFWALRITHDLSRCAARSAAPAPSWLPGYKYELAQDMSRSCFASSHAVQTSCGREESQQCSVSNHQDKVCSFGGSRRIRKGQFSQDAFCRDKLQGWVRQSA